MMCTFPFTGTIRVIGSLAIVLAGMLPVMAQQGSKKPLTRMLFVFDASNSMNGFWGGRTKVATARELLLNALRELDGREDVELALRVYGHRTPIEPGKQDCDDTRLEVPFAPRTVPDIKRVLEGIRCVGTTPIARSLLKAADDFPADKNARNIIILITDGIEACDEDPCAVSRALQAKGIILKPFVIGVGLEENDKYSLQCVGNYYDASSPELFEHVLKVVVTQALNTTTAQIDLLTADGKPLETDVAVSLYDQRTGQLVHQMVHTMNDMGLPDTLVIDPVYTYRIVVHTLPRVVKQDVKIKPGVHNVIPIPAGQGQLEVRIGPGMSDPYGTACIVRKQGEMTTLHVHPANTTDRYLVGLYDLEVLTLPRTLIPDVRIEQGRTNTVHIPQPGVLNVQAGAPGDGALFQKQGAELVWVADLDPSQARWQFRLQPGDYVVTYRNRNARRTEFSMSKNATIKSGQAMSLTF